MRKVKFAILFTVLTDYSPEIVLLPNFPARKHTDDEIQNETNKTVYTEKRKMLMVEKILGRNDTNIHGETAISHTTIRITTHVQWNLDHATTLTNFTMLNLANG